MGRGVAFALRGAGDQSENVEYATAVSRESGGLRVDLVKVDGEWDAVRISGAVISKL